MTAGLPCALFSLMANNHPKLAALAKLLAHKKGDINTLTQQESSLIEQLCSLDAQRLLISGALEEARKSKKSAEQEIDRLSASIRDLSVDPEDVRSIRVTPRKVGSKYGMLRSEVFRVIQEAGAPLQASDVVVILRHIGDKRLPLSPDDNKARRQVLQDLRVLRDRGIVARVDGNGQGTGAYWQLVSNAPTNQESS